MKELSISKRPVIISKTIDKEPKPEDSFEQKPLKPNQTVNKQNIKITDLRTNSKTPSQKSPPPEKPVKSGPSKFKKFFKRFLLILLVIALALGIFILFRAYNISGKIFVGNNDSLYGKISGIIKSQIGSEKLVGENEDQVNILLLGIGGPGHDGPYLSDTIILAQIRTKEKKATLTSIPRDYLVNTKEFGQRKINSVFAETYALNKDWDKAGFATRQVVEKMSGLTIPYFAVVDFKGFEKTIEAINGIEVTVDRTFTDYEFPNSSEGYLPAVTFTQGPEQMSGARALIYSRSRHAAGPEGSDYARSVRQQKVIQATKNKVVSLNIIQDAGKINELFSILGDHVHTNLSPGEILRLYDLGKDLGSDHIISLSLDPETGIVCPKTLESNGAFVITYCPGKSVDDIQKFFKESFSNGEVRTEQAVVWLADSSLTGKLYKKAEAKLIDSGLTVYKVIYNGKPLTQNVVHSVNNKTASVELIQKLLDANPVSLPPPGIKINKDKVDVIVILGNNDSPK